MRLPLITLLILFHFAANLSFAQSTVGVEGIDTIKIQQNDNMQKYFAGAKGALKCLGAAGVSGILVATGYSGTIPSLGYVPFVIGLVGITVSLGAIPFMVSNDIHKVAIKQDPNSKRWYSLVGAFTTSVVLLRLAQTILLKGAGWIIYTIPVTALIVIPVAAVLSHNWMMK